MADRHVLIVGASSGIGEALANHFLSAGCRVSAMARREDRLEALGANGAWTNTVDATDTDALKDAVAAAVEANGKLDVLLYCAGMQLVKPARMAKPDEIEKLVAINLTAPIILGGLFGSKKVAASDAIYCIVSSVAAERSEAGIVAYGATKAGVNGLIRGLARELGPRRVVGVAPGWLDTEMTQQYSHLYNDSFREELERSSPAGTASIDDVVATIDFLVGDAASAITGEIVRIDGGAAI